jgi:hypothetical protein
MWAVIFYLGPGEASDGSSKVMRRRASLSEVNLFETNAPEMANRGDGEVIVQNISLAQIRRPRNHSHAATD